MKPLPCWQDYLWLLILIFNGNLSTAHDWKSDTTEHPMGRRGLSRICNPAPLNIRTCNPKNTVLTFFPHHRCSYSMVSDCKSDTTAAAKWRHRIGTPWKGNQQLARGSALGMWATYKRPERAKALLPNRECWLPILGVLSCCHFVASQMVVFYQKFPWNILLINAKQCEIVGNFLTFRTL